MPLRKLKRKFQRIWLAGSWQANLGLVVFCFLTGYLIVIMNDSGKDMFMKVQDSPTSVENFKDFEKKKERLMKDPDLLKQIQDSPELQKKIKEKMGGI